MGRRLLRSFIGSLFILAAFMAPLVAQYRQVDQGRGATSTQQIWLVKVCDTAGGNCGLLALTNTGTANALAVRCVDPTGTAFVDCGGSGGGGGGTVAQGNQGSSTQPWFITGTITSIPAITQTSGTVNSSTVNQMPVLNVGTLPIVNVGTMPTVTVTGTVQNNGGTVTATPTGTTTITGTVTATSGTINSITMPSLTFTSGTVNSSTISQIPAITQTSGTVNSATISQMPSLTFTSGTVNSITMPSLTFTSGTVTNGTAAPVVNGGRSANDTTGSVANGSAVALRTNKWGELVIVAAPQDLMATGTFTLTTTTGSTPTGFAAPGANYRWLVGAFFVCNSSVTATRFTIRDNTTDVVPVHWAQTATTAGEPRCVGQVFNPPILMTANQPITVALSTAATDVRGVITAFKSGT